jgi:hypothetical protein
MPRNALYLAILALGLAIGAPAQAAKRVALLVGNGAYENVPRLQTAVNDARALGGALRRLGFSVTVAENQSRRALSEAFIAFDKAIEPGDVALLFFAGHGFEVHGQNYLLPVDVPAAGEGQEELIVDSAFTAERLVGRMQARGARTVILVLDACRNNPFERPGGRGVVGGGGLAPMTPVEGVFIVFAAGAKQIALDRLAANEKAQNSLFTRNLLVQLAEPGLTLVQIAKRLQADVRNMAAAVGHDQTPAYYDQIVGDVVLNGENAAVPQPGGDLATRVATLPPAFARPLLRPEIGGTEPPPSADPEIEELDALAASRSWQELRAYLVKVKPTARDAHWASLVEQAAVGELTRLASATDHYAARLAAIDDFDAAFPTLRESQKYRALRASVGLDAYRQCFEADRWGNAAGYCYQGLTGFVRTPPQSAELARGAARIAARGLNQGAAAPLLALAAEAPDGASICAEADLPQWLSNALVKSPDWDQPKAAVSLIDKCWDTVGPAMVAEFARHGAGSYYPTNTCPTFMMRNALTGYRAARCREIMAR